MSINWQFRPNTQDEDIYNEVYVRNCYRLPDDMSGITVIDIGANIGCFTIACLDRGAERVIAYEPDWDSYSLLLHHVELHSNESNCTVLRIAVVGDEFSPAYLPNSYESFNGVDLTGGKTVICKPKVSLSPNTYFEKAVRIFDGIEGLIWLKLDCEGAEYQILSSDLPWDKIERIFGEVHDFRDGKISRDTGIIELLPGAFGSLEPNQQSLVQHLIDKGYNVQTLDNPDDNRLALFWASRDEIHAAMHDQDLRDRLQKDMEREIAELEDSKSLVSRESVAVLTPFRNARKYLSLYFKQISNLKHELECNGMTLRLVAAEGDSLDGTRERIVELADIYHIPLEIVDTTHGHMAWGSVEDPVRMKVMSNVMNKALERVQENDDIVVWIMSDLEWETATLIDMIDAVAISKENEVGILAPMVFSDPEEKVFYDTWAYRGLDGARFSTQYPWHISLSGGLTRISSAGTCLVMKYDIAKKCRASNKEAVSFCFDARSKGYRIDIFPNWKVYHSPAQQYRLLWIGDAVCVSGFSRVSHAMFPILSEAGYEIDIIATNYQGTPHNYPYRIWPVGDDAGVRRLQQLIHYADKIGKQYDAVVVLDDPWNMPRVTMAIEDLREQSEIKDFPPVIAWVTVDGKNVKSETFNSADLYYTMCTTAFGVNELILGGFAGGYDLSVVPFGVNTDIYKPLDKLESRHLVSSKEVPDDAFIVGVVSTNQLRKRLDLVIKYFAEWTKKSQIDNAYLYLCLSGRSDTGCDVLSLIRYYGLRKKVIINESLLSEQMLAHVYNSFDIYMSLSQGEGFGNTALEAMACGVPTILSNWSGYSSWVPDDCAVKVTCSSTALSSPLNAQAYVIGGVADRQETISALHRLYTFPDMRERLKEKGLSLTRQMSWKDSGDKLIGVIEKVIDQSQTSNLKVSAKVKSA